MRARLAIGAGVAGAALLVVALGCGPGVRDAEVVRAQDDTGAEETPPPVIAPDPEHEPPEPRPPCAASPPSRASLAQLGRPGVLLVDPAAPEHTGACVSPAAIAIETTMDAAVVRERALASDVLECDATGTRCLVGPGRVLVARELDGACVPVAIVAYEGEVPDVESEAVLAGFEQRREACALHDLVASGDAAFYEVDRVRQVAPDRRGALASECVRGVLATAAAEAARAHWSSAPLACEGLRCRDATAETSSDAPLWLFANRISGPLRLDAVATGALPDVLARLRQRCR